MAHWDELHGIESFMKNDPNVSIFQAPDLYNVTGIKVGHELPKGTPRLSNLKIDHMGNPSVIP